MEPLILIINSHQLIDYQDCEEKYKLGTVDSLEAKETKIALTKGTLWHLAMARWYQARLVRHGYINKVADQALKVDIGKSILASPLDSKISALIYLRFMEYCEHWEGEELTPIAVEGLDENGKDRTGFTKILDEGDNYQILFEGKQDLIAACENGKKYWIDHKSQGKAQDLYLYSNQFMAYTWGTGMPGKINYAVFVNKKNDRTYRRSIVNPDQSQINQWVEETRIWTKRIIKNLLEGNWIKTRASCETRYGMCTFLDICRQTSPRGAEWVIKTKFQKREERYSSWR